MTEALDLEIVSTAGVLLREKVRNFYIPAFRGEAGILPDHLPYVVMLNQGELSYMDVSGKTHHLYVSAGYVQVEANRITVVTDSLENENDLLALPIQDLLQQSEKRIDSSFRGEITPQELEQELARQRVLCCKADIIKKIHNK